MIFYLYHRNYKLVFHPAKSDNFKKLWILNWNRHCPVSKPLLYRVLNYLYSDWYWASITTFSTNPPRPSAYLHNILCNMNAPYISIKITIINFWAHVNFSILSVIHPLLLQKRYIVTHHSSNRQNYNHDKCAGMSLNGFISKKLNKNWAGLAVPLSRQIFSMDS